MPRSSERNRSNRSRSSNDWGVTETVRERPIAAAAAAAGLFLWSRRAQISNQLSNLSDQIGDWTENMGSNEGQFETGDDTASLTTTGASARSTTARGRTSRTTTRRGMSETGGGNASLGTRSGGGGVRTTASGRGRVRSAPTT